MNDSRFDECHFDEQQFRDGGENLPRYWYGDGPALLWRLALGEGQWLVG
ncbi:MAG: hypothetical protein VYA84_21590 [Planctomycetota bacterium]|nr:hypothetical protein [Planctomycetota bacterium]